MPTPHDPEFEMMEGKATSHPPEIDPDQEPPQLSLDVLEWVCRSCDEGNHQRCITPRCTCCGAHPEGR